MLAYADVRLPQEVFLECAKAEELTELETTGEVIRDPVTVRKNKIKK
jgi:hypothetical protein